MSDAVELLRARRDYAHSSCLRVLRYCLADNYAQFPTLRRK